MPIDATAIKPATAESFPAAPTSRRSPAPTTMTFDRSERGAFTLVMTKIAPKEKHGPHSPNQSATKQLRVVCSSARRPVATQIGPNCDFEMFESFQIKIVLIYYLNGSKLDSF